MKRRFLDSTLFVVFLLVVVLVNIASNRLFLRVDLTEDRIYSLSDISRRAVRDLREPLSVHAFFTRDLPAPYNSVEQRLRDLLQEYAVENPGLFSYTFYPIGDETGMSAIRMSEYYELAYQYRILPVQIQVIERDEAKVKNAYMGVAFTHGDSISTIQAITSPEQMEYRITQAIRSASARASALAALEENIYTMVFLSSSLMSSSEDFVEIPERVYDLVTNLNRRSRDRLKFAYLDPEEQPEALRWINAYSVPALQIMSVRDETGAPLTAYASIVMTLGEQVQKLDLLQQGLYGYEVASLDTVDSFVKNSVDSLLGIHEGVGYLVDFGTPPYRGFSENRAQTETRVLTRAPPEAASLLDCGT